MSQSVQHAPARNPARRSPSEPSLVSTTSNNSGPSTKEPALITSTWGIGWQTPTLMLASYVLGMRFRKKPSMNCLTLVALAIAVAHLLLFQYLDGKEADGPNEIAPQSYISTASNILANTFGFFLRFALGVAFVQYLWHLLRCTTMKVSTIEHLFSIRSNPFLLLRPTVISTAPILFALAIIMVSLSNTRFPLPQVKLRAVSEALILWLL
jgi:hypothetical protein